MKFAVTQMNPTVGDIAGNAAKILGFYERAKKQGAEFVVSPELSLVGYPPEDLILMPAFVKEAMAAAQKLAKKTAGGPALVIGAPWQDKDKTYNAALLLDAGKILHIQYKTVLPNYGVFDEKRWFTPGSGTKIVTWRGQRLGILVCEDMWSQGFDARLKEQEATLVIVINASPFEAGKMAHRRHIAARAARQAKAPLIYANLVGGQDDIVFDGGSFVLDAKGKVIAQLPEFEEDLAVVDGGRWMAGGVAASPSTVHRPLPTMESLWAAMKLGLADYVKKNGFKGIMLGLSGGIDSALALALAVDALGANNVRGVLLPSPYTSKESIGDAKASAKLLGVETMTVPITPGMEIFDEVLSPVFRQSGWMDDVAIGGNVQARLRGITLMAISNKFGWLLLATSNKSEIAVGYTTLYGDSCGSYAPLKDLYKTQVYALANWRNKQGAVIPKRSITRAPTAELAPGQKDDDQLPPYALLDKMLALHLEGRLSAEEIIAKKYPKTIVEKVVKMVRLSEYKRRQSCPGVKLSPMLFGRDRRFPLTNKF
ncbi:MAG: NAD+ synthase [Pseudomonadota bacterium]|nr:NAD+ synthase [Pseudomonadota bacterium]MDE3037059.1 NAD+ synthase [Pseudomonadota bacterium]